MLLRSKWAGLIAYVILEFADQVLSKLKDRNESSVYCLDLLAITTCIKTVINNHGTTLASEKRASLVKLHDSMSVLSRSLSAGTPTDVDLRMFVDSSRDAVSLWK